MGRKIVIPGQFLSDDEKYAGMGTYVKDGKVYSLLYGILNDKNKLTVVPFSGKYIPSRRDLIIGTVIQITPSNWIFEICSPYDGLLHVSEYPRRIESSKMQSIMDVGDSAILRIKDVNIFMKVELTLRERGLGPIKNGRIIEIMPTKVPRVIGHSGSMISMLTKETNCEIFIGQNGRIWIKGRDRDMDDLAKAIDLIVRESHLPGLTDRVFQFLKNKRDVERGLKPDESLEDELDVQTIDKNGEIPDETSRKIDMLLDSADE
ncbi:MAG: RNA-binding protein [Methanosarcinaceae archaeon]|nr:RNA-binding protein [Methanosarcinaceae archaeon]